jgi:Transmembrane secretion effector
MAGIPASREGDASAGNAARSAPSQLPIVLRRTARVPDRTWMQNIAQSWLVYRLTGSSLLLGAVGFAGQIPVFLVAPIGGATAERNNRHRLVIATQVASMLLASVWLG